jgi:hypothetical protein
MDRFNSVVEEECIRQQGPSKIGTGMLLFISHIDLCGR